MKIKHEFNTHLQIAIILSEILIDVYYKVTIYLILI